LFIVIDALKADRCQGDKKTSRTPNIDFLIENGVYFNQAISSADSTEVSMSTIFSGLYPFNCTVRGGIWYTKLANNIFSFITLFKNHGYQAHATIPEMWNSQYFNYGFENEDKTYPVFNKLNTGIGEKILEKFDSKNMKEPWIYYIHLMDLHKPISVSKEFNSKKFGDDEYDRMMSVVDLWIGKILKRIDLQKTLFVLTSDHGDYIPSIKLSNRTISFGYQSLAKPAMVISKITPLLLYTFKTKIFLCLRNFITKIKLAKIKSNLNPYEKRSVLYARSDKKRFLYDELFRIPLIFCGSGIKRRANVSLQVRSMDIFPTITTMIGLPFDSTSIDGRNLVPLFYNSDIEELPVYLESSVDTRVSKGVIGIRTSKYKYFRNFRAMEKIHLYDLKNDPHEGNNIAEINKEKVNEMEKILLEIQKIPNTTKDDFGQREMTEEEKEKVKKELKKLGYL